MAAPPYMKLYWGDYSRKTRHLKTAAEHGVYLLLIGALWDNDGKLPADDVTLASHALCTAREWAALKPKILLFFRIRRGHLTQDRVTEELAKFRDTSGKRKAAGKSGGQARARKLSGNPEANAKQKPTYSESESEDNPPTPLPGGDAPRSEIFEQAWNAWPEAGRGNHGPDQASAEWPWAATKAGGEDRLLIAVQRRAAYLAKHPTERPKTFHRWLRDGGFASYVPAAPDLVAPWSGPSEVWVAIVSAKDEAFARSWLANCAWQDAPVKAVVSQSPTTLTRLRQEVGPVLSAMGIQILEIAA